jgi:hypothetical protein
MIRETLQAVHDFPIEATFLTLMFVLCYLRGR